MNPAYFFTGLIILIFLIGTVINLDGFILFKDSNFEFYQLLSSSFLHGNLQHLIFNSIALLVVSQFSEGESSLNFSIKWFVFAVGASIFSYFLEFNPVLGASGVVIGLFSYYYFKYKNRYDLRGFYVVLILNILIGLLPGISLWGHAGGAITGAIFFYFERFLYTNFK